MLWAEGTICPPTLPLALHAVSLPGGTLFSTQDCTPQAFCMYVAYWGYFSLPETRGGSNVHPFWAKVAKEGSIFIPLFPSIMLVRFMGLQSLR